MKETELKDIDDLCTYVNHNNLCDELTDCDDCPIEHLANTEVDFEGTIKEIEMIEVKKCVLIKDDEIYYWYCSKGTEKHDMPDELGKQLKDINHEESPFYSNYFMINEDDIKLCELYCNGKLV